MTSPSPRRRDGLSFRLRQATRLEHERAEASTFMNALFGGALGRTAYAALAGQLWFVYEALERVGDDLADDPAVGPFVTEELRRLPALERDLAELCGPRWRAGLEPCPAAAAYAHRIQVAADAEPTRHLGHHYTRYLGDLSGGQLISVALQRDYGLSTAALTFFDFPDIPNPGAFKHSYRRRLDALDLDAATEQQVIDEARTAFRLNTDLFDELAELHPAA